MSCVASADVWSFGARCVYEPRVAFEDESDDAEDDCDREAVLLACVGSSAPIVLNSARPAAANACGRDDGNSSHVCDDADGEAADGDDSDESDDSGDEGGVESDHSAGASIDDLRRFLTHKNLATARSPPDHSPRVSRVSFGAVQVLHHAVSLDESKLPSDGLAPMGLGALQRRELRRLESYEADRAMSRRGVGVVPPERRREVVGMKRGDLQRVEEDNARLKRAHAESLRDHILELRAARDVGGFMGGRSCRVGRRGFVADTTEPGGAETPPPK